MSTDTHTRMLSCGRDRAACRRLCAALLATLALAAGAWAQLDDPYDALLGAYRLEPGHVAQFSVDDGQLSPFWLSWPAGADFAELIVPDNCYPDRCGFSSYDDARAVMKAAYSDDGVYLSVVIADNTWVERTSTDDWGADAIDLYLDSQTADEIFTCTDCLIGLYSTTLSYCYQHFQVWLGGSAVPDGFQYDHYDPNIWSWQTIGITWESAEMLWGMQGEVVHVDGTQRALELFVPWESVGCGLDGQTMAAGGARFAMTFGYNDKDGDNTEPDCLRWLGKDPWASDAQTVNYWGDILLGPALGTDPGTASVVLVPYAPDPTTDRTPTLGWHPAANATNYKVVIDNDATFSSPLIVDYTGGATSYTPTTLLPYGAVYWRVSCNADYAAYSAADQFTVAEVVQPPQLIPYPFDSTTDRHPVLSWHAVDGATEYRIAITSDPQCTQIIEHGVVSGATRYVPTQPLPLGPVYWLVSSNRDYTKASAPDHFTVVELGMPQVRCPAEMASVSAMDSLGWHPVVDPSSAVAYEVTVSATDDFSGQLYAENVRVAGLSVCLADLHNALPTATMYFWRVRAVNERTQRSAYTPTASFVLTPSSVAGSGTETIGDAWVVAATANGMAEVRYTVRAPSAVRMEVFDMSGARVARIEGGTVSRGTHRLVWNGRTDRGGCAAGGVYVVSLCIGERVMRQAVRLSH